MNSEILLPDGTYAHVEVTPVPTEEVQEEPTDTHSTAKTPADRGYSLLEKARTGSGSTAAAGSDFFQIYRKLRAREMARIAAMDAEQQEAEFEQAFQERREARIKDALAKTAKKREKRQRAKKRCVTRKNV